MNTLASYRNSHLARGRDYHAIFTSRRHTRVLWDLERRVLDHLLAQHFPSAPPRHLDFACGTGRILAHLEGRTSVSVGVDVAESMLDVAREVAPRAELRRQDITIDPLPSGEAFDLITAFRFFPRAEPELRDSAMGALARLLTDEGLLVFNNHLNETSLMRRVGRRLGRCRWRAMSHEEVLRLMKPHGLEMVGSWTLGVLPFNDKVIPLPHLVRAVEWAAARAFRFQRLAQDVVYVVRKAGGQVSH